MILNQIHPKIQIIFWYIYLLQSRDHHCGRKERLAQSSLAAAWMEAWLEGLLLQLVLLVISTSQECPDLSQSRVICCQLCLTLTEGKTGMDRGGLTPTSF